MDAQALTHWQGIILQTITDFGVKILAAGAFWLIGRWLIDMTGKLIDRTLDHQKVDGTITRYLRTTVNVTLNILLVIGILGYFGIQTTTFAALFAAAGVAIGMAWSGLLSNFAAGIFLIILRPIKVGDFVSVAGITGTVKEIGLFATALDAPDHVQTLVGNNKVFSDTIYNYTANPYRRVELKAQLAGNANHIAAMVLLKEKIAAIPNVLKEPAVEVAVVELNLMGPVLAVRPYTHNNHYWQVYCDSNRTILEAFGAAGFPTPMPSQTVVVRQA